ncbi:BnaA05g19310D [Brassica napus]|uniref:(rape) hypothetical protein n=1 Tax=Brassica napus TaxID=3708 RepID=A0A078GL58_BRANA|nr:unnamed protein product [Brassica napus]CDY25353.1 BnaA05g19310D [Brassica napus]
MDFAMKVLCRLWFIWLSRGCFDKCINLRRKLKLVQTYSFDSPLPRPCLLDSSVDSPSPRPTKKALLYTWQGYSWHSEIARY